MASRRNTTKRWNNTAPETDFFDRNTAEGRARRYAILSAEGHETNDELVFAESGDMTLLGVRTLEGFGVKLRFSAA